MNTLNLIILSALRIMLQTFKQTAVDSNHAQDFLLGSPRYEAAGQASNASAYACRLLQRTDCFEFALRRYLATETRTCHGINNVIKSFLVFDERAARRMIRYSLDFVRTTLLENEWYELMPRYQYVRHQVQTQFNL